ncbi:MAG: NAD-dependent epimerase/dehydratase family protein [Actinobacteria bacterium]|nr:NAD-dependent epimerase/dehydratase family protein [Actinomycetota bacterium]
MTDIQTADLDAVIECARDDLVALRGARIFVTGGTGFVGTWLLAALHHADRHLGLRIQVDVLTRDPDEFAARQAALCEWANPIRGDVTAIPPLGTVDAAVHAATPASAAFNDVDPDGMRRVIVEGMECVLDRLAASGAIPMLFTSSGAVYGPQPHDMTSIHEDYQTPSTVLDPRSAYAFGKREAEELALAATAAGGPSLRLARLFAFVGPLLPLDAHFAVGNFIRDAIAGGPIRVAGEGTAMRSYMYAGDMTVALLAVLLRGQPGRPYNVGSAEAISIGDLARAVEDAVAPGCEVDVAASRQSELPTGAGYRYVPDVTRLRDELDVRCTVGLDDALVRTARWAAK